jgi:hypothetical protein
MKKYFWIGGVSFCFGKIQEALRGIFANFPLSWMGKLTTVIGRGVVF